MQSLKHEIVVIERSVSTDPRHGESQEARSMEKTYPRQKMSTTESDMETHTLALRHH